MYKHNSSVKTHPDHRLLIVLSLAVLSTFYHGCNADFEDATIAELKKPELLSVVTSPPEVGPEEAISVSFLYGDEHGVLENTPVIWLPDFELSGGRRQPGVGSAEIESMDAFTGQVLELKAKTETDYHFDKQGFAAQTIGLLAFTDKSAFNRALQKRSDLDLDKIIESKKGKLGIRTVLISNRGNKNENPRVRSVQWGKGSSSPTHPAQIVRSDDGSPEELSALRQVAADNPIEVREETELRFKVSVEDDDPAQEAIRYQWISTGGDFGGRRERVEKWKVPSYRKPTKKERDQTGESDVDPRVDPNLYPVWVIVRDNGVANRLGQCWAELYVRVIKK